MSVIARIATELGVREGQVAAAVGLLDGGATVPFIARYRKEATGTLDDAQLRTLEERLSYLRELEERRAAILASVAEQGKLTDELRERIEAAFEKSELEDLYLPYRPKRRTKATIAREKGLEPLALYLWRQQATAEPLASTTDPLMIPLTVCEYANPQDSITTPNRIATLRFACIELSFIA